jgi:electron transport complex, rnfABCDGE type, G subunit
MKSTLKLALTLTVWSVIACCALALVNSFAEPIIEARTKDNITKALAEIFPEAKTNEDIAAEVKSDNKVVKFNNAYLVKSNDETLGVVITATGPTYNSSTIMIGVRTDGTIKTIKFIANDDTKGIGTRVLEPPFSSQFDGKPAASNFKVGADVQGLSGATVSSKGVAAIVKAVSGAALQYLTAKQLLTEGAK